MCNKSRSSDVQCTSVLVTVDTKGNTFSQNTTSSKLRHDTEDLPSPTRKQPFRSVTVMAALIFVIYVLALPCNSLQTADVFRLTDSRCFYSLRSPLHRERRSGVPSSKSGFSQINRSAGFINRRNTCFHSEKLLSLQMIPFHGVDDLIFRAQSTASDLMTSLSFAEAGPSTLAIVYFAGLLTSFSPCSLGLLPLTLSYISTAAGERNDKSSFLPTLAFAAGLGVVFCGFGLSASFLGGIFGQSSDNVIGKVILALLSSGVSLAMGLQLLDVVNIPLPSLDIGVPGVTNSESENSSESEEDMLEFDDEGNLVSLTTSSGDSAVDSARTNAASLFRTFLLGGSSALVASPCATPVLTSILAFVALSQNAILGATLLLTYTAGYTTPILVVGATGGEALAKAQAVASGNNSGNGSIVGMIGGLVNPFIASILIASGTTGILTALFGDPSLAGISRMVLN